MPRTQHQRHTELQQLARRSPSADMIVYTYRPTTTLQDRNITQKNQTREQTL